MGEIELREGRYVVIRGPNKAILITNEGRYSFEQTDIDGRSYFPPTQGPSLDYVGNGYGYDAIRRVVEVVLEIFRETPGKVFIEFEQSEDNE